MSSAQTRVAVAPSASTLVSPPQIQKDCLEEQLPRQNSLGNRQRGGPKGRNLTRSHAMRESASPPRTPTPRSGDQQQLHSPSSVHSSSTETLSESRVNIIQPTTATLSNSPSADGNSLVVPTQQQSQLTPHIYTPDGSVNTSQLDLEFPKLTPPKSKSPRNPSNNNNNNSSNVNNNNVRDNGTTASTTTTTVMSSSQRDMSPNSNHTGDETHHHPNNNGSAAVSPSGAYTVEMATSPASSRTISGHTSPIQPAASIYHNNMHHSQQSHHHHHQQQQHYYDKENRCPPRENSYNSANNSPSIWDKLDEHDLMDSESPTDGLSRSSDRMGKKHRSSANAKGSKPRLKTMGSSSSVEGSNNTSGFISRDSSTEHFTDQNGIDLIQFFADTLNKNIKDRNMLMRIERELVTLAYDKSRTTVKFPPMSSYNRMLIHRAAAYFGMEHNVDACQQSVIAAVTKATRVPEVKFKTLFKDTFTDEPPKKSILKRDSHSFDDSRHHSGLLGCPDRHMLDRKAKSFEEREEEYERAKQRIFKNRDGREGREADCIDEAYWPWSSSDSSDQSSRFKAQNNRLLKVQSLDHRHDGRPSVSKSHSFGGYGGPPPTGPLMRGDSINSTKSAGPRLFSKQDSIGSTSTPWRLSPSSSGSIYHFDPSNLPHHHSMFNKQSTHQSNPTRQFVRKSFGKIASRSDSTHPDIEVTHSMPNEGQGCENTKEANDKTSHIEKEYTREDKKYDKETKSPLQCEESEIIWSVSLKPKDTHSFDDTNQPKHKHQATSPNIPSPEPQNVTSIESEIHCTTNTTQTDGATHTNIASHTNRHSSSNISAQERPATTASRSSSNSSSSKTTKISDDIKQAPLFPLMGYTTTGGYSALPENSAIFPTPAGSATGGFQTTYQPSLDGNVYAIQQPMMYAYPTQPMDSELSGYFVPMYEQPGAPPRDGLIPTPGTAIYAPSTGTAVVPLAYPSSQMGTTSLYTTPLMYAPPEQYPPSTPGTPQYPMGYPITYPYPYNAPTYQPYWGPMTTYYLPQGAPIAAPTSGATPHASGPVPVPVAATPSQTPTPTQIITHSNYNGVNSKRGSPPQTSHTNNHSQIHSQSSHSQPNSTTGTPTGVLPFPPPYTQTVPLTTGHGGGLSADHSSGGAATAMYAIPQQIFQLPYPTATHIPPPSMHPPPLLQTTGQHNHNVSKPTVINQFNTAAPPPSTTTASNAGQMSAVASNPSLPLRQSPPAQESISSVTSHQSNYNPNTSNGTPQSAPSTPLAIPISLPLSAPPPSSASSHQKHPPLFPTPPLMPNGYMPQHHRSFDYEGGYDKKSSYNPTSNRRLNNNYTPNGRPHSVTSGGGGNTGCVSYQPQSNYVNPRKSMSGNNGGAPSETTKPIYNKRVYNSNNPFSGNGGGGGGSGGTGSPHPHQSNTDNKVNSSNGIGGAQSMPPPTQQQDKPRGMRGPKPANLDLRRSTNQRNTPSTNSNESNNSPNSLSSGGGGSSGMMLISGGPPGDHPHSMYMTRGPHIPSQIHHQYHHHVQAPTSSSHQTNAAIAHAIDTSGGALGGCQQSLISTAAYNPTSGMYVKLGQPYFAHHGMPNSRKSPPNDGRPPLTPIYSTVNMVLPARPMGPPHRQQHHQSSNINSNYKGSKMSR